MKLTKQNYDIELFLTKTSFVYPNNSCIKILHIDLML